MSRVIAADASSAPSSVATVAEPPFARILVAAREAGDGEAELALAARIAARERAALERVVMSPDGEPSHAIAARAHATGADLVVLDIGRSGRDTRAPGSLTSAQLAVLSDVPVLAVAPHLGRLPELATVHAESPRVARALLAAAARVLAAGAVVTVVRPRWSEPHELPGWSALDEWWSLGRDGTATPLRWRDPEAADGVATELTVVPVPGGTPAVRSLMSGRVLRAFQRANSSVLAVPVDVLRPARGATCLDD